MPLHPKRNILSGPTPLERAEELSKHLKIDLHIKRDDLAGPSFGGNKARQLEYYFGEALSQDADTILITGAVQSNFTRTAVAVARSLGMDAVVQFEDRVKDGSARYRNSGNVLLSRLMGAEIEFYPEGEDEAGADVALDRKAALLRSSGRRPYIIHLSEAHPPLGALGYVDAATELLEQNDDFDVFVVASGSGVTHAGLLAGLRGNGSKAGVIGSCVRRDAALQGPRIERVLKRLGDLYTPANNVTKKDIRVWDGALAPGYGRIGQRSLEAIRLMASLEGLFLDPVYTAKSFSAIPSLVETGDIPTGARVCFVHTGGLAALYAYEDQLGDLLGFQNR